MAAIIQMNKIPIVQWKGQTFDQIHSTIKKNDLKDYSVSGDRLKFKANPLKIYRREIANTNADICNVRTSTRLDIVNQPNGTIINSSATVKNGLVSTVDNNIPNNTNGNTKEPEIAKIHANIIDIPYIGLTTTTLVNVNIIANIVE